MARTYKRDARGRFASGGGGGNRRPATKGFSTGRNRLTRDNSGKITSQGGNGATARGGRLRTAGGKLRARQVGKLKGAPSGVVGRGGKVRGGKARAKSETSKPQTKKGKRGGITSEKVSRVASRVTDVTRSAAAKTGVKKANTIEVGVRAKEWLTRKAGGMSGMAGKTYAQQQEIVRNAMTKPPRYSTQKPNRNKPRPYNGLGQAGIRAKQAREARSAHEKIAEYQASKKPVPPPRGRLMGRRELFGGTASSPVKVRSRRIASTLSKPAKPPALNLTVRTKSQAKAFQRYRREGILNKTREINQRGYTTLNNSRIRRQQTGMTQLSLVGRAKPLVRFRPVSRR